MCRCLWTLSTPSWWRSSLAIPSSANCHLYWLTYGAAVFLHDVQVPVDSPDRFLVEIQFSNGANCDPTNEQSVMQGAPHTLPTQPRRLLTPVPGVSLHGFQELVRKYARGKNTPSNYQLQVSTTLIVTCQSRSRSMACCGCGEGWVFSVVLTRIQWPVAW
jgi:hypothetical protein